MTDYEWYQVVKAHLKEKPELMDSTIQAMQDGVQERLDEQREVQVQLETILSMALTKRHGKKVETDKVIAKCLTELKGRTTVPWEHFTEELA